MEGYFLGARVQSETHFDSTISYDKIFNHHQEYYDQFLTIGTTSYIVAKIIALLIAGLVET